MEEVMMNKQEHNMPKSQQLLLAAIIIVFILEVVLTIFFITFSSAIFKGLTIFNSILIGIFLMRQIKRKGI